MGRITTRRPVLSVSLDASPRRRADTLAVEEPLELRIDGSPLVVTMRTPGHDVELAAGFLLSEGIIRDDSDFRGAIHCGGPGTGGAENTYNVLDIALGAGARLPESPARRFTVTSACGVCGRESIDEVERHSSFDLSADASRVDAAWMLTLPDRLRAEQAAFDKTGGLHAAGLFDTATGDLLVVREDVGRHNAVDKVLGWALLQGHLPLTGTVLQVSGRASFELVQKCVMAGVPFLSAVSAPSSLAVDLAERTGLTLAGFVRGASMNVYSHGERLVLPSASASAPA
ncbi:formate dehydrogenase accessory sulfurtransferase FdhD [Microbacterium dextranolyticum]|uniref:formate dehydrogenase accessory sulfurtransferase FdhD n=1 Tax=Microbacterium dextranolyticum TaxID=36806 RepID=UPI00195A2926|nr:formate dehydrogenase accessory sulfurtransferase FdhD [Microbacterium dextranolyticum]MBM7464282.1 FdhD protein [Microbacterium dextranolyticum]